MFQEVLPLTGAVDFRGMFGQSAEVTFQKCSNLEYGSTDRVH